jgi:gliding motility-associated-like protein
VKGTRYMWAPNSFTPNFDGLNDVYRLYQNQLDTSLFGLYIYNPQQKPIFYTNSYNKGWDGILEGKPAPAGNYPVIIKYLEADGDPVEKRICIYILPYDSTNNCFKSDNKTDLIFGDQFDPVTSAIFPTNETICN